ncbi:MAG TPA: hypothetical protein VGQ04_19170 [Chitinophagaceae bacterium]|nr:hypothetical protein [Chitinophagaceae bacterium]
MYKYFYFIFLFFVSCINKKAEDFIPKEEIKGNWLILYPQHILKTDVQRKIYGRAQDSIINFMGLKLVSFKNNGEFLQTDSFYGTHGKWVINDTGNLRVTSAGKGFENFNGVFSGIINDTILIEEMISLENEPIKLVWHLKKIVPASEAGRLFKNETNQWRQRSNQKETDAEIRKRIISMLKYYSIYFKMVSVESIYFSPVRVFFPFSYYQHGIGLKEFNSADQFARCFFDRTDAKKGYEILKEGFEKTKDEDFPGGENYVIEYSKYFERLAKALE